MMTAVAEQQLQRGVPTMVGAIGGLIIGGVEAALITRRSRGRPLGWRRLIWLARNHHSSGSAGRGDRESNVGCMAGALSGAEYWVECGRFIHVTVRFTHSRRHQAPRPSHLGGRRTAGEVMTILPDEQIHHGAEIALLGDLHRRFGT
jgi:hypothetical protein